MKPATAPHLLRACILLAVTAAAIAIVVAVTSHSVSARPPQLPATVQGPIETLLTKLRDTHPAARYTPDDYFADLDAISRAIPPDGELARTLAAPYSAGGTSAAAGEAGGANSSSVASPDTLLAIARLALALQAPGTPERLARPRQFYGRYSFQIPDQEVFAFFGPLKIQRFPMPQSEEIANRKHSGPDIYPFVKELATPADFPAWEAWLLAPDSRETRLMHYRIREALYQIRDPRCIPLVVEEYKIGTLHIEASEPAARRDYGRGLVNLIRSMPGDPALDALLDLQHFALAHDFAGEGYSSTTAHLITTLSSRSGLAEQLADPKFMETLHRSGGDIDATIAATMEDDLWKTWKPLLEARLTASAAGKVTTLSAGDISILQAALAAMPKSR